MRTLRKFQAGCLLALLVLAGCAEQKEGERCDRSNADLDCESGLRCTPLPDFGAVCCPDNRPPTEDVCRTANIGTGGTGGTGGSSTGGGSSGGTSSGGAASGGTGGTLPDASTGLLPDAGIDGAP